jgi:hypothetical protein
VKPNYGWNTWASSLPKEYLAEFIVKADKSQIIYIDDILPKFYRNRTTFSQNRMKDLYTFFIKDIFNTLFDKEPKIDYISEIFDFKVFLKELSFITFDDAVRSMPEDKRKDFSQRPSYEIIHLAAEEYIFNRMISSGIDKILKGSGQFGLINESNFSDKFEILKKGGNTTEFINNSSVPEYKRVEVISRLKLWEKAKLLRGYSSIETFNQIKLPDNLNKIVEKISNFYNDKPCSLMLTGSLANFKISDQFDTDDIDFICFSDSIIVPDFAKYKISSEIEEKYISGDILEISIALYIDGKKVSIRFIKPNTILNYFSIPNYKHSYWRMTSLKKQGDDKLKFFDKKNRTYIIEMLEKQFLDGFLYNMPIKKFFKTIINPTIHMILSGRMIVDNLVLSAIKLSLIKSLTRNSSKFNENIVDIIKNFRLAADIEKELLSICLLTK